MRNGRGACLSRFLRFGHILLRKDLGQWAMIEAVSWMEFSMLHIL